jgi:hypothetical protein
VELSGSPNWKHIKIDYKMVSVIRCELEMTGEIPQSNFRTGLNEMLNFAQNESFIMA